MVVGIFVFAVGYAVFDLLFLRSRIRQNPALKRTVFIGYGLRMTASAIFPVGMMLDMWSGMASVMIVSSIRGLTSQLNGENIGRLDSFPSVGLCTVLQGIFLNAILFAFMLAIYCVVILFGVPKQTAESIAIDTDQSSISDT